jgi:hypothetical protein
VVLYLQTWASLLEMELIPQTDFTHLTAAAMVPQL